MFTLKKMDALEDNRDKAEIKPASDRKGQRKGKKPPKKITETYLRNSALAYLQRFAASTVQFRRVMDRKIHRSCLHHTEQDRAACAALLDALVADLQRTGLLNDALFLQGFITSMRRRGLSRKMMMVKLQEKGFSSSEAHAAIAGMQPDNIDPATMELAGALRLARRKKIGPYSGLRLRADADDDESASTRRALAAMARAGFSFETSQKAITLDHETAEEIIGKVQALA